MSTLIDCQSCGGFSTSDYGPACWKCVNEPEPAWMRGLGYGLAFTAGGLFLLLVLVQVFRGLVALLP